jgi:hypothetical protein
MASVGAYKMVSRIQLNHWKNLEFYDPVQILRVTKELEAIPLYGSSGFLR